MNNINVIATGGGLFAVFCFIHFFVDWIFQSHAEAMVKHNNWKIRAKHCIIYSLGFIPIMFVLDFSISKLLLAINILFWSHFYLDTYHGVYLWAKYIRKPPEMTECWKEAYIREDGLTAFKIHAPDPKHGFIEFIQTTLGKILMIVIDQISHLIFIIALVVITLY